MDSIDAFAIPAVAGSAGKAGQSGRGAKVRRRLHVLAGSHTCAVRRRVGREPEVQVRATAPISGPTPGQEHGDALTGLTGSIAFSEAVTAALANGTPTVLLVSLARFKTVNEGCGRSTGEALLRVVAQRLRSAVREDDVVGRLSDTEFAVLLRRGAGPEALGARIIDLLGRPYLIQGRQVSIGAHVGIALGPQDGADAATLVQSADLALVEASRMGRPGLCVFQPGLADQARSRLRLETDLRRAITLRQFELHFQPQVRLADERLTGFEALVRWRHPVHGLIPPSEFIPLAEEIGVIVPLGEWVLRSACLEAATWPGKLTVAVNVSALQLEDGARLQRAVAAALAAAGLPAPQLEIEITESALAVNAGQAVEVLHELRAMGVGVSMDDFGTGYSSLSQLRSFPFTKLKLDRSFVRNLSDSAEARAVVRAIASLGNSLGMTTTAEGVETPEQAGAVRAKGYTYMQGYLVSQPVPASEMPVLIARLNTDAREGSHD